MEDSIESIQSLVGEAKAAGELIKSYDTVRYVSHNDCDGITSAAIMSKALLREGKSFRLSFVKQLDARTLQEFAKEKNELTIFTDLGSGYIYNIDKLIQNPVLIIDHHQQEGEITREDIFHFNPLRFGIADSISGSGLSYLVARAMSYKNRELSEIAIIGGIGDSQIGAIGPNWGMLGLNREILKDAQDCNKIRVKMGFRIWGRFARPIHKALQYCMDPYIDGITGSESACIQFLNDIGIEIKDGERWRTLEDLTREESQRLASGIIVERMKGNHENPEWIFGEVYDLVDKDADAGEFSTLINACGKMQKPYMGVALLLNDMEALSQKEKIMAEYRREIGKSIQWIQNNKALETSERAYFVFGGSNISDRFISNVVSTLYGSLMPKDRPVFALADSDNGMVKVSARAGNQLVENGLNLKELLPAASRAVDGEGGGHAAAAGALIPKGAEDRFISMLNNLLKNNGYGQKGEEKEGREEAGAGKGAGGEKTGAEAAEAGRAETSIKQEVERKGLVRYISS